jgi:serine/threonine protein kinase
LCLSLVESFHSFTYLFARSDAANCVRTIFTAIQYLHAAGIVHRDLKPENLLYRTNAKDADIMITDFGLSSIVEVEKLSMLTELCGTPGYMAPEIFLKSECAPEFSTGTPPQPSPSLPHSHPNTDSLFQPATANPSTFGRWVW